MNRTHKIILGIVVSSIVVSVGCAAYFLRAVAQPVSAEPTHASMYYYDNKDFFPASVESFAKEKPLSPAPHIFIVNQHILAAHLIAQQFALAASPRITTVVLITQNNWNAGSAPIITSRYGWKTPLGDIAPAKALADNLITKKIAYVDEDIFAKEHGITGIVPYVAHSFPHAAVIPLVIRDGISDSDVDALALELSTLDPATTVIVGSIDMSHYLPKYIADAHDRLTVQSIENFDYETLPRLDIDTVPTLRTVMKVAEHTGQKKFVQTGGINSSDIVGDPDLVSTTSYITGYFTESAATADSVTAKSTAVAKNAVHMLFVGDNMFDRGVARHAAKNGMDSLFANIERLFLGTHVVIANFEGTMTDKPSIAAHTPSILRFTFDPSFANLLKKSSYTAVSLANNHALDFGGDGYRQTVRNLQGVGIAAFGEPRNESNLSTALTVQGKSICLVGYHDLYIPDPAPALKEIAGIRASCDYVVLFAHWGVEYQDMPTDRQKVLAHKFIDGGADLVIGAHPHVVEPVEIYKNKAIFYSLGNFVFDQNFSFATVHGLAVNVEWSDEKTLFTLAPTSLENTEVHIADAKTGARILSTVANKDSLSADIRSAILTSNTFTLWNTHHTK